MTATSPPAAPSNVNPPPAPPALEGEVWRGQTLGPLLGTALCTITVRGDHVRAWKWADGWHICVFAPEHHEILLAAAPSLAILVSVLAGGGNVLAVGGAADPAEG